MLSDRHQSLLHHSSSNPHIGTTKALTEAHPSSSIDEKSVKDIIQILSKCIEKTKNQTEFSQILQVDKIEAASISGHTDFYYPSLNYQMAQYQQELPEITKIKRIPIPHELVEQFNQMQITCRMGLFTCITRAWLTIDNLIFFWNYEDGSDISFYDNLTEAILAVELFTPRPGTFEEGVEYGLCLATTSNVVLLSIDFIRFTKGNGAIVNEMKFSPQPIYSISTENSIVNTIKASKSTGRLFMGATDGYLYEFFYQNQANWFGSQTKRINLSQSKFHYFVPSIFNFNDADSIVQIELDETRQILYTRSENSTLQVFYLGSNGLETSKISQLTSSVISSKAAALINTNDKNLFTQIIHIAALKRTESKNINLVAVTKFGIRLYFSVSPFDQQNPGIMLNPNMAQPQVASQENFSNSQSPSTFQLVHVRIPPNIDMSSQNRQGPISSAFLNDGVSLMVSKRDDNADTCILLNRDTFLLHSNFKESKSIFDIDGRIWAIDEVLPSLNSIRMGASENDLLQTVKSASGVENVPKLSAEFFDCPRRFVMITPQGCFVWNKLRPIDQLYLVLKESNGPNSEGVRLFFNKIYERSEACSLCLAVALIHSNEPRINEWATHAFFIYSGEPEIKKKSSITFLPPATSQSVHHPYQHQFTVPHPPQQNQFNPHSSLISESGCETMLNPDQSILLNHNPYYQRQQPQQQQQLGNKVHFGHMSYINSPQPHQMSTPMIMRTKDQFNQQQSYVQPQQPYTSALQQGQQMQAPLFESRQDLQFKQLQSECEIHFSGKHDAIYIYMSRLLAPIWDLKLLCELTGNIKTNDELVLNQSVHEPLSFATFTEIDLNWFLNKLNELKRFLDINFAHLKTLKYSHLNPALFTGLMGSASTSADMTSQSQPSQTSCFTKLNQVPGQLNQPQPRFATQFSTMPINLSALINLTTQASAGSAITEEKLAAEIENGSIFLMKQFLNRIIEIIGLWKILEDHKYHFISTKLDDQTQLTLMRMQVKTFLLADNSLLEKLITAMLYRYIDDNACTDLLNQSLKQMCPSLYSNENAIYSKACERLKQAVNMKNDGYERERLMKEAVDLMKQIGYVANLSQVCETLQSAECYEAIFELCLTAVEKRDPQNIGLNYYRKSEPHEDTQGQYYFNLRADCYKCMLEVLNSLLKTPGQQQPGKPRESSDEKIQALIKVIVNSDDELAHVSLFNWMLNCGFEKKLVTVDSPFLEGYLVREIKDHSKNRVFLDLLWRHYDFRKDYQNAAKVLTALAEKYSESRISLKERVEYLTQAIVALNSTQKIAVKDEVFELNDKKDLALLQEKIYAELGQMEPRGEAVQDALIQLDSQLFDITKLYFEFAEKFDLFQCQLAIFKMARHDDPKIVEVFWKQIIATELDKISKPDIKPCDLKNQLADNIVNIAKEYVDEEKYFPLDVMIDSLEFVSLSRGFEPEWSAHLLRKLSLPFNQLIQEYNRVYSRKDIKWAENSSRFINTIYCLIDIFTKAPNATNENDKVYFLRTVKDLIPKYMTELNSINDELSKELISKFKTLNYMLERM